MTIDLSGDGGVLKDILTLGTGDEIPLAGCKVSLHYTGTLTDGTVFDSSIGREPFEFDLGKGRVIKAFDMGVATMKLGEVSQLTCAPSYAYGAAGSPPSIPPNSTLIFKLEMLGWKGEDISPNNDGSIERMVLLAADKKRTPTEGALIKVHLTGKHVGKIFEERESEFPLGEGSDSGVIEGVELALQKIAVGETSRLKIKSKYAYGNVGNEALGIPPNAEVEYTVKLIECERRPEEWKLCDDERVKQSEGYKEKGTSYFKKSNYKLAIKMYNKCITILPADSNEDSVKQLKIAAYSNIALCYQKMNDHFEGKQACNEALTLDNTNIKALYRRGQCNLETNEFREALLDFQRVVDLEPGNKAAINQLLSCKRKIKDSNDKEKHIYRNMFTKLAATDKEPTPTYNNKDVLSMCGEWADEEGHEADLAFEHDDNIVMI